MYPTPGVIKGWYYYDNTWPTYMHMFPLTVIDKFLKKTCKTHLQLSWQMSCYQSATMKNNKQQKKIKVWSQSLIVSGIILQIHM